MKTLVFEQAKTLAEAVGLRGAHPELPVLAGGTDLIVQWRSGLIDPPGFIDLSPVAELATIAEEEGRIVIGAMATHAQIMRSALIAERLPVLAEACRTVGAMQIQNRGTIGGNIVNASPCGNTLPVLAAYDAELLAQNIQGKRWIRATEFFPEYRKTALAPDELLTHVRFPIPDEGECAQFYKIGTRRAQAVAKVALCARACIAHGGVEDIAIGLGSVAPTVMRAPGTEALLRGRVVNPARIAQARRSLMDEVKPIDDVRSTADYRRQVCGSLIARFLHDGLSS